MSVHAGRRRTGSLLACAALIAAASPGRADVRWALVSRSTDNGARPAPATVHWTNPAGGAVSAVIDAALKVTRTTPRASWEPSLALEYHRDTTGDRGHALEAVVASVARVRPPATRRWRAVPELSVSGRRDAARDTRSVLVLAQTTVVSTRLGLDEPVGTDALKLHLSPTLGIEHERISATGTTGHGEVTRLYASVGITAYPLFERLDEGKLAVSATAWH